jgi:hypothetical protein
MRKTIYITPNTRKLQILSKSSFVTASDKTGTLIVSPDTNDGDLKPNGEGDASGGMSKKRQNWYKDE